MQQERQQWQGIQSASNNTTVLLSKRSNTWTNTGNNRLLGDRLSERSVGRGLQVVLVVSFALYGTKETEIASLFKIEQGLNRAGRDISNSW